ncbi:DUF3244 domain-containing protein [uncultured Bacteroides sp.]|uniref:DUF3244 domain-containing protein n=1 Tax=uncultured Bacteroides sp. TaxID=162156 RepID=UPI0025E5C6F4|nr:DUF3244 domain-containing protein [uncultured Bacteroides sp.]
MIKKLVLFVGLLSLLVTPVLSSVHSTKYIYLRSTESAKMKKKLRSFEALPIQATLEMNQLQIYFYSPLSLVNIAIINNSTGEEMVSNSIVVEAPTTYVINLNDCEKGDYIVEFMLLDDTISGDFIIDE